jgi:hypothetical protein
MKELAAQAHVTKDTVQKCDHDLSCPDADLLALIAARLAIPRAVGVW